MDIRNARLRPYAFEGNFGLEREALRLGADGHLARTPHPFPPDHPRIVRDFCECQTEINTRVHPDAASAVEELRAVDAEIRARIAEQGERLWTNSNPPPDMDESEIEPANFTGPLAGKTAYRGYLAEKYGKRLMAYCGIHVNFSFGERLVAASGEDRNALYLHVAAQCVKWGWAIVALTAASPEGEYASARCSEIGYWNNFIPILDFSSVENYARSIADYVRGGQLAAPSELYYPIRLKPRGQNLLRTLVENGIDHIEIRCVDLNPLTGGLVDARDVEFIRLFMLWCAAQPRETLSPERQADSVGWFKAAAHLDYDWTPVGELLERMGEFYTTFGDDVKGVLAYEAAKVYDPKKRYARMEACLV